MLFGKRGKNDLLALNVDYSQAETFITERMNKQVPQNPSPQNHDRLSGIADRCTCASWKLLQDRSYLKASRGGAGDGGRVLGWGAHLHR